MENTMEISNKETLDISSKLVKDGTQYNNIMSIAILRDCGEETLAATLKKKHCQFANPGDDKHTYIIFNKPAKTIAKVASHARLPSFIYCHANTSEMWRMKNEDFEYNSVKNPYIFAGNAEVTLSDTLLHNTDEAIGKAIDAVRKAFNLTGETDDHILDYIYNRTGMEAGAYRKYFTESLSRQPIHTVNIY